MQQSPGSTLGSWCTRLVHRGFVAGPVMVVPNVVLIIAPSAVKRIVIPLRY